MKSRVSLLAEIVGNPLPNSATLRTLKEYGWDCDSELVIVSWLTDKSPETPIHSSLKPAIKIAPKRTKSAYAD
jgi:hypothetical protein